MNIDPIQLACTRSRSHGFGGHVARGGSSSGRSSGHSSAHAVGHAIGHSFCHLFGHHGKAPSPAHEAASPFMAIDRHLIHSNVGLHALSGLPVSEVTNARPDRRSFAVRHDTLSRGHSKVTWSYFDLRASVSAVKAASLRWNGSEHTRCFSGDWRKSHLYGARYLEACSAESSEVNGVRRDLPFQRMLGRKHGRVKPTGSPTYG